MNVVVTATLAAGLRAWPAARRRRSRRERWPALTVAGTVPLFVSVIGVGTPVEPTATVPKSTGLGVAVTVGAAGVPYVIVTSETACRCGDSYVPAVKPM